MSESQPEEKQEEKQPEPGLSFETERKASRKFIEGQIQTFIQWMPFGGSGFTFVSFLLKQDWFMAIAMFPVMCVTVVWAAYTESFLRRLQEVYSQRGREDVDSLMARLKNWDEALRETIRWQLAGTEDKYLECQGKDCSYYTTEGLPSTFKALLTNVFIPLELSGDFFRSFDGENLPMPPGFKWDKKIIIRLEKNSLSIWDIFQQAEQHPQYRNLTIQAWGGYGKTTLLRNITYVYTAKIYGGYKAPKLIPVLLYLRKWQDVIASEKPSLIALIEKHHIPNLPGGKSLKLPPNWVKNLLEDGKILVMFDGFDEVKEEWRKPISLWIGQAMSYYSRSYFILTSRPAGYRDYVSENQPLPLLVKPFNQEQRDKFINGWYRSRERLITAKDVKDSIVRKEAEEKADNLIQQLDKRSELNDLAKNPLLLNMIVNLHSYIPYSSSNAYEQVKLPYKRTELYREIFRLQLGDRPLVKQINMVLSPSKSPKVLQKLALSMMQEKRTNIDSQLLMERLQSYLYSLEESAKVSNFIKQIEQVSELLVKTDKDYEFAHLSFQAYLASVEIEEEKQDSLLLENYQDSWWKETILLYVEQKSNPNKFIGQLCDLVSIDSVGLAYECMKVAADKVDKSLEDEIQRLRYEPLEEYLKNQDWQNADIETNRLMLQTVGREENDFLRIEEMQEFPCEDLRTIDRLWVKYSDGRFGFSVQKRIYQELGGTEKYDEKILEAFGDRVGWVREEGEAGHWPMGHLGLVHGAGVASWPSDFSIAMHGMGDDARFRARAFGVSSLAQRLVTCSIE